MPTKRPQIITNEIYHIVLRGVEQRDIFLDTDDYYRGIFSLYEFNTKSLVEIRKRRRDREKFKREQKACGDRVPASLSEMIYERDLLVEIFAFCFMPNHIHLLLRQIKPGGISKFIQKLGAGYPAYFNKKYERVGHLFQGRYRVVHIKTNEQLKNVFVYIHTNSIALVEPGFKEKGIKNSKKASKFLEDYRWSSYQDYIGKKNFPSVTEREFLLKAMGGEKECKNEVEGWIKYKGKIALLGNVILE